MMRQNNPEFELLMAFIAKNRVLPEKLADSHIGENAFALKAVLDSGNANDPIFADENCQLYLIHLLKTDAIGPQQFLTAYIYLLALMQFSEKQPIHSDHLDTRRTDWGDVYVYSMQDPQMLDLYMQHLYTYFPMLAGKIDVNFFSSLSTSESWLIAVPFGPDNIRDDVHQMSRTNLNFSKFLQKISLEGKNYYLIPSMTFVQHLLQIINPERQIEIAPFFGKIGIDTLFKKFHSQNKHPVTIHSPYIMSNPSMIHERKGGPLPFALHDIFFHSFAASAFSKNDYDFLFNYLLPKLMRLATSLPNEQEAFFLNQMIAVINDLAYGMRFMEIAPNERLTDYLKNALIQEKYAGPGIDELNENEMQIYYRVLHEICQAVTADSELISNVYNYNSNLLLAKIITKSQFITFDLPTDPEQVKARQNEVAKKLSQVLSTFNFIPTSPTESRLTTEILKNPALCVAINQAGYVFLPPIHPLPTELFAKALKLVEKPSLTSIFMANKGESSMSTNPPNEIFTEKNKIKK